MTEVLLPAPKWPYWKLTRMGELRRYKNTFRPMNGFLRYCGEKVEPPEKELKRIHQEIEGGKGGWQKLYIKG